MKVWGFKMLSIKKSKRENWLFVYLAFISFFIVMSIFSSDFRSLGNLNNLIVQLVPLAVLTIGQTMVIITGGIDLSVGAVMSLGTVLAATQMQNIGIFPAIFLILLIGAVIGIVNGMLVSIIGMNPFITTIGTMIIVKGLTLGILPGPGGIVPYPYVKKVMYTDIFGLPLYFYIFVIIYLIMCFVLYKLKYGANIYAVGGNKEAAYLAGISYKKTIILTYMISSILAISGGLLIAARISSGDPLVGDSFQLETIGSAAIGGVSLAGGTGGLIGALGGVMIFGSLSNMLNMLNVTQYLQFAIKSLIIIAALAFAIKSQKDVKSK